MVGRKQQKTTKTRKIDQKEDEEMDQAINVVPVVAAEQTVRNEKVQIGFA